MVLKCIYAILCLQYSSLGYNSLISRFSLLIACCISQHAASRMAESYFLILGAGRQRDWGQKEIQS